MQSVQALAAVAIVRPPHFTPNRETAVDNSLQQRAGGMPADVIAAAARST